MKAITALFLCLVASSVEAKPSPYRVDSFSGDRYVRVAQGGTTAADVSRTLKPRQRVKAKYLYRAKQYRQRHRPGTIAPLTHVAAPLAAKARQIETVCGSRIISAVRHTHIAGTGGRLSLHASGRAIDIKGNPSCIYAQLRGWPGGVSVDYARVQHVHFSYAPGGPEWGVRFNHYSGRRHRHARRRT